MVNTSSTGVGGIWLLPNYPPKVYWHQWPMHIQKRYRDAEITNSDLEMAGVLVAWFILETCAHLRHTCATVFSDNTPTVSWMQKLMSHSKKPTSARLLRALAMRARTLETQVPTVPHWAGKDNRPADAASRSFDPTNSHCAFNDTHFLHLFNSCFPLPQAVSWQLLPLPLIPLSQLISTLGGQ
jgi:ribonuclease HI